MSNIYSQIAFAIQAERWPVAQCLAWLDDESAAYTEAAADAENWLAAWVALAEEEAYTEAARRGLQPGRGFFTRTKPTPNDTMTAARRWAEHAAYTEAARRGECGECSRTLKPHERDVGTCDRCMDDV